jgi:putative FmdB family regulatory protein
MSMYEYRCDQHGSFDLQTSMGDAQPRTACPECGLQVPRVFTAPMTSSTPRSVTSVLDRTEKSRYEPEVVSSLPRRPAHQRTPTAPANPALQRLPRP